MAAPYVTVFLPAGACTPFRAAASTTSSQGFPASQPTACPGRLDHRPDHIVRGHGACRARHAHRCARRARRVYVRATLCASGEARGRDSAALGTAIAPVAERLSPSSHLLPMVICCGRLVVVSSIPPGDFIFVLGGHSAVRLGVLVEAKKRPCGTHS